MNRMARLIRIAVVLVASLSVPPPTSAEPAVGEPVVYPGTDPQGTAPPSLPVEVPAEDGQALELFIDYENNPDVGMSQSGVVCVNANGDETCGFDVKLEMQTDGATFGAFAPASAEIVGRIDPATQTTLRVNGIDTTGMPIPAPIGTLVLDAAGAHQLQIAVTGMHRVGAAGQLDAIQEQVIVVLPEPGAPWQLGSGLLALRWLAWRRRRASTP